jgi:hypothetical protein
MASDRSLLRLEMLRGPASDAPKPAESSVEGNHYSKSQPDQHQENTGHEVPVLIGQHIADDSSRAQQRNGGERDATAHRQLQRCAKPHPIPLQLAHGLSVRTDLLHARGRGCPGMEEAHAAH